MNGGLNGFNGLNRLPFDKLRANGLNQTLLNGAPQAAHIRQARTDLQALCAKWLDTTEHCSLKERPN
jgi:hypothetical protein